MPSPAATGTNRTTKRPTKLIMFCIEMHWSTDFRGVVSLKQIILDECFLNLGVPHNPLLSPWNVLPPCLLCPPDFASRRRKRPLWRLTMELVKLRLQTMSWIFNNYILIIYIYITYRIHAYRYIYYIIIIIYTHTPSHVTRVVSCMSVPVLLDKETIVVVASFY